MPAKTLHPRLSTLHSKRGVIALVTVVIMGAMLLSLGLAIASLAQTELIIASSVAHEREAFSLATTCIEEAAHRLKLNASYAGGTVPLGTQSCTVSVSGSGSTRTVIASSTSDIYTKSVTVTLTLKQNAALNARAWEVTAWAEADPP